MRLLLFSLGAFAAGLVAGCASGPEASRAAPPPPALVAIENPGNYSWRITFAPGLTQAVAPGRTEVVRVPAGTYEVTQEVATTSVVRPAPRKFTATFAAGQTYHWPLGTAGSP